MKDQPGESQRGTQTLVRGLDILRLVGEGTESASGIAAALGVPRSTAQRLLASLLAEGYLRKVARRGYVLGPQLIHLGARARDQQPVLALAAPVLRRLAAATGDTVHLGVPEGDEVLYLDKVAGTRGLEMRSRPGQRMPLAFTGLGKAMLVDLDAEALCGLYGRSARVQSDRPGRVPPRPWEAFRDDIALVRRRGCSFDLEENEIGIRCIGAPVRDTGGGVVAGLSVASAAPFLPESRMAELAPLVLAHAAEISRELGWRPDDD
ncbi:IclR family transcriptional regulator [Poseidonocella sp. HB161398]|uniref:IclR family transcriptional regulator n=1 Tax=Poseidonocella sp. HB161398 TaxID=2320855 RepID=UPI00110865D9|nr:IclR family transcriptional regulator [Poseidonocella sp. HB161398]